MPDGIYSYDGLTGDKYFHKYNKNGVLIGIWRKVSGGEWRYTQTAQGILAEGRGI